MKLSCLLCLAIVLSFGDAFAPQFGISNHQANYLALKSLKTPWESVSNLAHLEGQYQELWQNTNDLMQKEKLIKGSADVAEKMLEAGLKAVALQRYKHVEIMDLAERQRREAIEGRTISQVLENQAHNEAAHASWEMDMLELIDASYEDMERVRESARLHAAQHLEHDMHEMALEDTFIEMEAEAALEDASAILARIKEYETMLKGSLKELHNLRMEQMQKGWENKEP
jgi:hypothetical protein